MDLKMSSLFFFEKEGGGRKIPKKLFEKSKYHNRDNVFKDLFNVYSISIFCENCRNILSKFFSFPTIYLIHHVAYFKEQTSL